MRGPLSKDDAALKDPEQLKARAEQVRTLAISLQIRAEEVLKWYESRPVMQVIISIPMLQSARQYWMVLLAQNRSLAAAEFMWQWQQDHVLIVSQSTGKYHEVPLTRLSEAACLSYRKPKVGLCQEDADLTLKYSQQDCLAKDWNTHPPHHGTWPTPWPFTFNVSPPYGFTGAETSGMTYAPGNAVGTEKV